MRARLRTLRLYRGLRVAGFVAATLPGYLALRLRARLGRPADDDAWRRIHERTAARAEKLATDLQGALIKFAQVIAARPDVFPEPFVERLSRFHDDVPPRPFDEFLAALEAALGRPPSEVFASIDARPLAAASLAQVHSGRLHDGRAVAIKLQYPEVARVVAIDVANVGRTARLVSRTTGFDLRTVAGEIAKFVTLELDFVREARSTERIAKNLASDPSVVVPEVYAAHCGPKLLVLELLAGTKITDVPGLARAGHDPVEVLRRVARIYASMVFDHGFFQGDPHPGNLLVLPDGRIGLLDFGMCKELPPGFGARVAALSLSVLAGDAAATAEHADALGLGGPGVDAAALQGLVRGLLEGFGESASPLEILDGGPVDRVPEDLPLVLRTFMLLGGLSHSLAPRQPVIELELLYALLSAARGLETDTPQPWA